MFGNESQSNQAVKEVRNITHKEEEKIINYN